MKRKIISFVVLSCLAAFAAVQPQGPKEPVYVYLYARITDHVNLGLTEDRIHRVLSMVDTYRRTHPEAHVSATILFSGAVSGELARRNPQTHIVDFVKGYIQRGVIEAGYDGGDEPTYVTRPTVDFTTTSDPQQRWLDRKAAEEKFLTEGHNPVTGAPEPGKPGGLKEMQEVFGQAACITGINTLIKFGPGGLLSPKTRARVLDEGPKPVKLPPGMLPEVGGDSEAVGVIRQLNTEAIMFGVPDTNPAQIPGFRDGRAGFSGLISPGSDTSPELYWQDNVLRSSEASNDIVRLVHAYAGAEAIQKVVQKVDRTKVHVVHVELGEEQDYLQPEFLKSTAISALQYAYDHPDAPQLPASALRPQNDVDAAFAKEDALLKWVTEQFLPNDQGSRFVSSADLRRLAVPATGFSVSMDGLRASLDKFLKNWGNDTFAPPLFQADGHYLSRAELFQVMTDALAEQHRAGKFPESIKVMPIYGPVRVLTGHGPNVGEVSEGELARICEDISAKLHNPASASIPNNSIPIGIPVEGTMLNPAQFLRLMAYAISTNPAPSDKLAIHMTYEFIGVGQLMPRSRPDTDDGFIWTLKPAELGNKLESAMVRSTH